MMERELILLDDDAVTKRQRREDAGFPFDGIYLDGVNYDEIIDNWLSEELSLDSDFTPRGFEEMSSHDDITTLAVKKKRRFSHINNISKDPTKIRIPRILKSDIRKKYPVMFVNMLNMCDLDLIELFFHKYTNRSTAFSKYIHFGPIAGNTPTIQDKQEKKEEITKKNRQDVSLNALNDVVNFVILLTVLSPDRCVKMKRSEIITRSDTFSSVVNVYFELYGTRISHWTPIDVGKFLLSLQGRHEMSRKELIEQFEASLPKMETFVPLHVEGKFTLNIDNTREDLRISNIVSDSLDRSM